LKEEISTAVAARRRCENLCGGTADEGFLRAAYNSSQQASRGYECNRQTRDVLNQRLEPRDVLCFQNEYSDEVWSNPKQDSYYKGFAGAKPACTMRMVKEGK